ncbi:MAG: hypothetical protein GXO47_06880, partial [Chlorobi bacterium]|nr:hypothetical protein [Chlorobiota bacterium]
VYRIYERYSSDKYFDIFATGFFSLFSSSLFYGILLITFRLFYIPDFGLNSAKGAAVFGVIVLIINYIIFLPKQRQLHLYQKYKEVQSTKRDVFTIILSIASIALMVYAIRMK